MDIQRLRRETEDDHRAVEETFPLMHEELSVTQYVSCLLRMHGMVSAWEERSLEHTFGPAYGRYKEQVRWRVLPGVY